MWQDKTAKHPTKKDFAGDPLAPEIEVRPIGPAYEQVGPFYEFYQMMARLDPYESDGFVVVIKPRGRTFRHSQRAISEAQRIQKTLSTVPYFACRHVADESGSQYLICGQSVTPPGGDQLNAIWGNIWANAGR